MLSILSPSANAAGPGIEIVRATWSDRDVTELAQKHCEQADSCTFNVEKQVLGVRVRHGRFDLSVSWKCSQGEPSEVLVSRVNEQGRSLNLSCASHQRARNSFASLIQDPVRGAKVRALMPPACSQFLSKLYQDGGSLKSQCVTDLSESVDSFPFLSGKQDRVFYHYTNSEAPGKIVSDSLKTEADRHDELFTFFRNRSSVANLVLFVAEDPISSQSYGSYRLTVTLKPDARVLRGSKVDKLETCVKDLDESHPGLSDSCGEVRIYTVLMYALLEDSGVALWDYYGAPDGGGGSEWFQLVGPESIEKIEHSRR